MSKASGARSTIRPRVARWIGTFPYRREVAIGCAVLAALAVTAALVGQPGRMADQQIFQDSKHETSQGTPQTASQETTPEPSKETFTGAETGTASGAEGSPAEPDAPKVRKEQAQTVPSQPQSGQPAYAPPGAGSAASVQLSETQSAYWLAEGRRRITESRIAEARTSFAKSLKLARVEHDKKAIADASAELGYLHLESNALNDARNAFKQSLALYEELSDKEGVAKSCRSLGVTLRQLGRYSEAEQMYIKAARLDEATMSQVEEADDYNGLGLVYLAKGQYDLAEQSHIKALQIHKRLRQDQGVAEGYANLGQVYYRRGDFDRSADMFKKAIAMEGAAELRSGAGRNYSNLGAVFLKKGDLSAACVYWAKAREILRNNKAKPQLERVEATMRSEGCGQENAGVPAVSELFSFLGSLTDKPAPSN